MKKAICMLTVVGACVVPLHVRSVLPGAPVETLYVDVSGNDSNDGKSWGTAKRTVGAVLCLATNGTPANLQTIAFGAGLFDCTATVTTNQSNVAWKGLGPGITTVVISNNKYIRAAHNNTFMDMTLTSTNGGRILRGSGNRGLTTNVVFINCEVTSPQGADALYTTGELMDANAFDTLFSSQFDSDISDSTNGWTRQNCRWIKNSKSEGNGVKINGSGVYWLVGGKIDVQNSAT